MSARREFLVALAAGALAAPRISIGQPAGRVYRVSMIGNSREAPFVVAFERRLKELGYIDGKNLAFLFRVITPDQYAKLPETAAEASRWRPDVAIVPGSELGLRAFRQAMPTTPIVMIAVDFDPVERNFITSLARPGGNITGVFLRQVESAAKRLDLLKEAFPKVTRVAVLFDAVTRDQYQAAEEGSKKLGVALLPYELRDRS